MWQAGRGARRASSRRPSPVGAGKTACGHRPHVLRWTLRWRTPTFYPQHIPTGQHARVEERGTPPTQGEEPRGMHSFKRQQLPNTDRRGIPRPKSLHTEDIFHRELHGGNATTSPLLSRFLPQSTNSSSHTHITQNAFYFRLGTLQPPSHGSVQAPTVPKKILARCGMLRHAAARCGMLRHAAACCGMLRHASSCWSRVPSFSESGTGFKNL